MYVSDFPMVYTKLDDAEPTRPHFDAIPMFDDTGDKFAEVDSAHTG